MHAQVRILPPQQINTEMEKFRKENPFYKAGLVIGGLTGLFWCAMTFNELVGVSRVSYANIIQALAIGGLILLCVGIACRNKLAGGIMLVAGSLAALLVVLFYGLDYLPAWLMVAALPLPVFLAGVLFIASRFTHDVEKPKKNNVRRK